jgi:hypothetical protein
LLCILAAGVYAASVHLKGGRNAEPAFHDGGISLQATGALSGLGNENVVITIDAMANVTATCANFGGHQAPGQNPAPISVSGSVSIPAPEIKNGNTPFSVVTVEPDPVIPGAPDCPNPNWTEMIDDLSFTAATITVQQPAGHTVLVVSCTIDPPTEDGNVPKQDVTCTSS